MVTTCCHGADQEIAISSFSLRLFNFKSEPIFHFSLKIFLCFKNIHYLCTQVSVVWIIISTDKDMSKKSIRFFNDREVRAVWDEEHSKWWFSATDIVRAINDEEDYVKAGNYWRWLKKKLNTDGVQLVSVTHDFKFQAPDGKQRFADALDAECVQTLAKNYPNNRANDFLDWFTYSDSTIDGQSKKKAYTLFESGLLDTMKPGTVKCLQQIHAYLFGGLL